jgi:hypothetical protein
MLSDSDKTHLHDGGAVCCSADEIAASRRDRAKHNASWWWARAEDRDYQRLLTTINNGKLRTEICRLYAREYPGDDANGCPADRPPPATIVTDQGDVPLTGAWPR